MWSSTTSRARPRQASRSPTRSSSKSASCLVSLPPMRGGRGNKSLAADHEPDAVRFDVAELHGERHSGEFELDALAHAVAALDAGRGERLHAPPVLHDVDPALSDDKVIL